MSEVELTFPAADEVRLAITISAMFCHIPIQTPDRDGLWFFVSVKKDGDTIRATAVPHKRTNKEST